MGTREQAGTTGGGVDAAASLGSGPFLLIATSDGGRTPLDGRVLVCESAQEVEDAQTRAIGATGGDATWQVVPLQQAIAAPALLAAARKFWAFYLDLAKSNPGFMARLALQNYAQWNEAVFELPIAISAAEGSV